MKAMILAAGLGTRLGELTRDIPKPMLDIHGRPLLDHTVRHLVSHGFDEIMINLHFLPEMIQNYLGDGSAFGARIEYVYEDELLGTAGGVKNAAPFFNESEPFLVIYGDLLTNQNLRDLWTFHIKKGGGASIILHQRHNSNSLVQLEDDGTVSGFVERPSEEEKQNYPYRWVNSGIQIISLHILSEVVPGTYADLPRDIYPTLARQGKLFGLPLTGDRIAIDSPERYEQAKELARTWQSQGTVHHL